MPIKDIVNTNIQSITPLTKVKQAARILHDSHIGALVVTEKVNGNSDVPVGIITDRDIAIAFGSDYAINSRSVVKDTMNRNVIVAKESDGIYETIRKMSQNGIRRMPVINKKDKLVGVVTSDDLLTLLGEEIQQLSQIIQSEIEVETLRASPDDRQLREKLARL